MKQCLNVICGPLPDLMPVLPKVHLITSENRTWGFTSLQDHDHLKSSFTSVFFVSTLCDMCFWVCTVSLSNISINSSGRYLEPCRKTLAKSSFFFFFLFQVYLLFFLKCLSYFSLCIKFSMVHVPLKALSHLPCIINNQGKDGNEENGSLKPSISFSFSFL